MSETPTGDLTAEKPSGEVRSGPRLGSLKPLHGDMAQSRPAKFALELETIELVGNCVVEADSERRRRRSERGDRSREGSGGRA